MPVTAPIAVPIPQPRAFMRPMLMPISCAATWFSATARMAISVGLKRKNAKRTVINTSVTRKIRTMPNAVSAYRLPSASPLTSSCPHGRSMRVSGATESMLRPSSSFLRPTSAQCGPRASHAQHPYRAVGEVVGDRGLGEPPFRPVPAMNPRAHPEESEGGELGVGPDERAVAHAVPDNAFEQVTHRPLLVVHLPQRRRRQHMLLTEIHANRIEVSQNAEHVRAHHCAQLLGARSCPVRDGSYLAQDLICSPLEQSNE